MKRIVAVLLLAGFAVCRAAWPGTGTYKDGSPDLIDLRVLFMYDEQNPQDWEPLFKEASKLLYDATEGQVKLGKVEVYVNCPQVENKADVKIYDDHQEAGAHTEGMGSPGARIRLSQTHKTVTTSGAGNRGQLGLVHELGHYAFGLKDEYEDKNSKKTAGAYCIDQSGNTASLMDAGTTTPTNQRHELCWSGNHRAGQTEQCRKRKIGSTVYEDTDSWTWLAAFVKEKYGATLTVPTSDPAGSTAGHGADPQIEYPGCGLRSVLCIDRSGSMAASAALRLADGGRPYEGTPLALSAAGLAPIDLAKQGAGSFIQLLEELDRAGVTSFSDAASVDYPMNQMSAANKASALAAISGLQASGSTNIGGGLQASLGQITGEGDKVAGEVIVLLSDGMHNTGTDPDSVLPALKQRGVTVHTIGLGQVDAALMSRIARETGGTYLFASTAAELNAHFLSVLSATRSKGIVESEQEDVGAGGVLTIPVFVDSFTSGAGADFLLAWGDPAVELSFSLKRPDGTTVLVTDPGVTFEYDASRAFKRYNVVTPAPGAWSTLIGNPSSGVSHATFQVQSSAVDAALSGDAGTDVLAFPEPLRIRARVTTDQFVGGATVTALIRRPFGSPVPVVLHDSGELSHGDDEADDGTYSALFRGFFGDGSYTIDLAADTQGAVTVDPGEKGGEFISEPVDRFVREKSFSLVVEGTAALDGDHDGALGSVESAGPNSGDGNGDGVADDVQPGVASFLREADGGYTTLIVSGDSCGQLTGVASGLPAPPVSPPAQAVEFPLGVMSFLLECASGKVEILLHGASTGGPFEIYRFGPTPEVPSPHWHRFDFDGKTGAEIVGNRIILHLVDGERGDDDLTVNGVVVVGQIGVATAQAAVDVPGLTPVGLVLLIAVLAAMAIVRLRLTGGLAG